MTSISRREFVATAAAGLAASPLAAARAFAQSSPEIRVGCAAITWGGDDRQAIADTGIPLAYHHHMNSIGEPPDAIARILDAADPRYVRLLLDIAHYQQGGGDPVAAVRHYADRLIFLHVKDVESVTPGSPDLPGR